jgi:predicted N-acetyltransferase YhbS
MSLTIRNARPDERGALSELHRRSSYVWEEDRANLDAHPDALGVTSESIVEERVRVATGEDGALMGFSVVAAGPTNVCVLDDLFVEPALLRRGIGRALVEDAVARAASAGCATMTVVAHSRNFAFYESVGFVRGETTKTRFGPATTMRRQLTSGTAV